MPNQLDFSACFFFAERPLGGLRMKLIHLAIHNFRGILGSSLRQFDYSLLVGLHQGSS